MATHLDFTGSIASYFSTLTSAAASLPPLPLLFNTRQTTYLDLTIFLPTHPGQAWAKRLQVRQEHTQAHNLSRAI
jgi:hypothetical protein